MSFSSIDDLREGHQPLRLNSIEVTFVKLPAVVTGGSVVTATGLLLPHLPPLAVGAMALIDLAAFAWYVSSVTKRQKQAQESALNLVRELRGAPVSVVVRADGQVEIQPQPVAAAPPGAEASSSDAPGSSSPR